MKYKYQLYDMEVVVNLHRIGQVHFHGRDESLGKI